MEHGRSCRWNDLYVFNHICFDCRREAEMRSRDFEASEAEVDYFCVAEICHLGPGCACFIGTSVCRKMTKGVGKWHT